MVTRKLVSYCLLFAFTVLLTPRGFWHDCDHHVVNKNSHHTQVDRDHCFACDYHISIWSMPSNFSSAKIGLFSFQQKVDINKFLSAPGTKHYLLRGPPVA